MDVETLDMGQQKAKFDSRKILPISLTDYLRIKEINLDDLANEYELIGVHDSRLIPALRITERVISDFYGQMDSAIRLEEFLAERVPVEASVVIDYKIQTEVVNTHTRESACSRLFVNQRGLALIPKPKKAPIQ